MTVLNLNTNVPRIDVQLDGKNYPVYANDENIKIASSIASQSTNVQGKLTELAQGQPSQEEIAKLLGDLKATLVNAIDQLLEPGAGEKIWKQTHGSSEAVARAIGQIQEALKREREKQAKSEQDKLNESFPVARAKKRNKNAKSVGTK
ncbi:hypothetical protein [Lactobacillus delbrueckii]|uniref:hypothetical protein n=1 Tax=Lactobacillus delbrueckii TaxID=1584 RepID=UPI0004A5CA3A|nr:hypothetical protein [Lactobacillus delbrueckii]MCD5464856.1 hypothetical protein [Lactobacillus delbrueckii subsp. bulgaricus]MCT3468521.1 hypothetical protein [Lactobacillus delbrueckii subsp. bulgaricus]CDR75497.1 Putative uncharacterized protein [Lactobacillus delbrueckii subsp. bulgaricus]